MRYQRSHVIDLADVFPESYPHRDELAGVKLHVELAKARRAASWPALFQRIALVNQRALRRAKEELGPEAFADIFGAGDDGVPQIHGEAVEVMAAYCEDVLQATLTSVEGVEGAEHDPVEAIMALGVPEAFRVAQHLESMHRLTGRDHLSSGQ